MIIYKWASRWHSKASPNTTDCGKRIPASSEKQNINQRRPEDKFKKDLCSKCFP